MPFRPTFSICLLCQVLLYGPANAIPTTLTVFPTAIRLPNGAMLNRLKPATTIAATLISLGDDALTIGDSVIPFATPGSPVPVTTVDGEALFAGAAGVEVGSGRTISFGGPPITLPTGDKGGRY